MKRQYNNSLIACSLALTSFCADAAGFRTVSIADNDNKAIEVGIWYPSNESPSSKANSPFKLPVAIDASISQPNGALIVLSHGYSGWYGGHADTAIALADAGFIVAAPSHTGNTYSDMSSTIDQWAIDRPRHISRVIDHALEDSVLSYYIKPEQIGLYGYSAGGFTAISLLGGIPNFDRAKQHCQSHPNEFVCINGMVDGMFSTGMNDLPASAWGADNRIQSAVIAAPAFGIAYDKEALRDVTASIQLWSAEFDHSVPTESNAAFIADNLATPPETHWVPDATHFAFIVTVCRDAFKKADPKEYELVCRDQDDFDRYAFHTAMHEDMVTFFSTTLNIE